MAAVDKGAAALFTLLRSILRLHRKRLPPPMRRMGDTYVLSEFRCAAAAQGSRILLPPAAAADLAAREAAADKPAGGAPALKCRSLLPPPLLNIDPPPGAT